MFNTLFGFAQLTHVPDNNFEASLITLGVDDVLDNYVLTDNIKSITRLDVRSRGIKDLTGIAAFESLNTLYCQDNLIAYLDVSSNASLTLLFCESNALTSLDVSSNTALKSLFCRENAITSLDISSNSVLATLYCSNNSLISLDVNSNTSLTTLDCSNNFLTTLDIKNGKNLSLTIFNSENNENLVCIQVDSKRHMDSKWSNEKDDSATFSENCGAVGSTYIPDNNFEQVLIDLKLDDVLDNYVVTDNIKSITTLNISNKNITYLTGIEDFEALLELDCSNNNLGSLEVTTNSFMTDLNCAHNALTNLSVKENSALLNLNCSSNTITSLDVISNSFLTSLNCSSNALLSLNLGENSALISLNCSSNNLIALDIKNGNNSNLSSFNSKLNASLSCITVDSKSYMDTNWSAGKVAISSFNEFCDIDIEGSTNIPDNNFEQALINLGYDSVLDNYVLTDNIKSITRLEVGSKNISDLTGIKAFESLTRLSCLDNSITNLDVSLNRALTSLNCSANSLTSLDVSKNTTLVSLYCHENEIVSLDISANTVLTTLYCSNNSLTSLDIKNGNNSNLSILNLENNINLDCIQVDSKTYMNANWSAAKDDSAIFNEVCSVASIANEYLNNLIIIIVDNQVKVNDVSIQIEVYNFYGQQVLNSNLKGMYIVRFVDKNNHVRVEKLSI